MTNARQNEDARADACHEIVTRSLNNIEVVIAINDYESERRLLFASQPLLRLFERSSECEDKRNRAAFLR